MHTWREGRSTPTFEGKGEPLRFAFRLAILPRLLEGLSQGNVILTGAYGSSFALILASLRASLPQPLVVIVPEPEEAEALQEDLATFGLREGVFLFPPWDLLPSETDSPDMEIAQAQVAALQALRTSEGPPLLLVSTTALLQPAIDPPSLERGQFTIREGMEVSLGGVMARLIDAGFEAVVQVEQPGEFARRGGILDVFPLLADRPVRIEFFGDTIESVRPFDVATQVSEAPFKTPVTLIDVTRDVFRHAYEAGKPHGMLFDHLPSNSLLILRHPERIRHAAALYQEGFDPRRNPLFSWETVTSRAASFPLLLLPEFRDASLLGEEETTLASLHPRVEERDSQPRVYLRKKGLALRKAPTLPAVEKEEEFFLPFLRSAVSLDLGATSLARVSGGMEVAKREFRILLETGARITVFCHNAAEQQRLRELLPASEWGESLVLAVGSLSQGFFLPAEAGQWEAGETPYGWAAIGDHEIFGRFQLRRTPRKRPTGLPIQDFADLRPGDYVVHIVHGIARFEGIETLDSGEGRQDFLRLRFAEDAFLYVPLSHIEWVQRYIGSREARPPLSKLGGTTWAKRKRAAEAATRDLAADLLRIQAIRRAMPGIALPADDTFQKEFDAAFPYEETPDQETAMAEIKADQERPMPMDRLLCGDVGFGKTELAIRAAFKAVQAGYQVAILAPTTILAEQHHRTFSERFADYPVTVGCLSRFRSPSEQKRLLDHLAAGRIDVMIGTHRLLSEDVVFKNLGLAIIDEEQRFGVEHKEKLKAMRASIDILTLTATPIPRTLHMALLGLRDISVLATPPIERQAIRTVVLPFQKEIIRRATLRELARGGQCFFVHNRVQTIEAIAKNLAAIVPEARIAIAHGQMPERELLDVMLRFLAREIDLLVCTTIIESGVDIPTVNTLFVNDADHFGLAELHQLRGRVGRYRYQAYAYFLVSPKRPLSPEARKRLHAIEEYTELGAGFRLALRDLEIRGAGNLLGPEQSGHIHHVGYELYCRLLEQAVREFRGEDQEESFPVELDLGSIAFLPPDYIDPDPLRIEIYRRLAAARNRQSLEELRRYVRDRFGPLPLAVERLFEDEAIRIRCRNLGIDFLGRIPEALVVGFHEGKDPTPLHEIGRKVMWLEGRRWRVALEEGESYREAVEMVLARLEAIAIEKTYPPRRARR